VNHAGRGFGTEALRIVSEGVTDFATVDRILRDQVGFKLGPFELMDLTALDVSHPVMESIYHQYYEEPRFRPSVITAQRLAGGVLGKKVGEGFYSYHEGVAQVPDEPPVPVVADIPHPLRPRPSRWSPPWGLT
jgi:3-hydroxybutyryl-CoA dehydrogenase